MLIDLQSLSANTETESLFLLAGAVLKCLYSGLALSLFPL